MTLQELRKPFSRISVEQHGEAQIGTHPGFIVTAQIKGQKDELSVTAASEKDALVYFLETYPPLPEKESARDPNKESARDPKIDPNVVDAQPIVTPLETVKPLE